MSCLNVTKRYSYFKTHHYCSMNENLLFKFGQINPKYFLRLTKLLLEDCRAKNRRESKSRQENKKSLEAPLLFC